jgi:hypothetical protein
MLTDSQTHIIIFVVLIIIVFFLNKKTRESFETVCKNGQCFECKNKVYRNDYCYVGKVTQKCPKKYKFNNSTSLCDKNIVNENKKYIFTARPNMVCKNNELQLGKSCVLQPKYYFDPKYT